MKRYGGGGILVISLLLSFILVSDASSQYLEDGVRYAPDRIVVQFKPQFSPLTPTLQSGVVITGIREVDQMNQRYSVSRMRPLFPGSADQGDLELAGYYALTFARGFSLESVLTAYDALTSVDHVEPDGIHRVSFVPNDPFLGSQWGLTKIQARQAWDISRGDSTVPLAILDTGVDWNHPDLDGNVWTNSADPIDGLDNDGNGKIDDFRGWDWVDGENGWPGEDDTTPDNNPMDFDGHGTHVSGIASAETNNGVGVAGLGFNCEIMCLRIGWRDADGNAYVGMSFAASAIDYARLKGAKAINCSWGSSNSGGIAAAVTNAINAGIVVISAAGNDDSQVAPYLCSRTDVIAVAATDGNDHRASWSNYGIWVDVCAPGTTIYSTYFNDTYTSLDGTSMSAPFVTGLVGLIRAAAPSLTRLQVTQRIINTADDIDALNPGYEGLLGSGRINAYDAVFGLGGSFAPPIPISPISNIWINNPHPRFTWADTSSSTLYHLMVDDNTTFASPLINDSTIADTFYVATDSLVDDTWYWKIRGGNGSIWTAYTSMQSFRIDTHRPNTTTLMSPAPESWTNDPLPLFTWQAVNDSGGSGVATYYIQVDSDSTFTLPLLMEDSTSYTSYYSSTDLPPNSRVFWRVRARDNAGNYGYYATAAFNLDNIVPGSPISFDVTPDFWTVNPDFAMEWINPADPSGISKALYKIGSAPMSNYDTSGHFSPDPPASYHAQTSGQLVIYLWLVDGAGNVSYLNRSQDTMRFDNTPPTGCVASSPSITSLLAFTVSWSTGSDIGSGLAGIYDVRFRDGLEGSWTDWISDSPSTSDLFSGENGHTYYFEARTRDLLGNLEPFSGTAESQTVVDTTYQGPSFVPGDANGNGIANGMDVVYLVNYLKGIGPAPPDPILRADANGSCSVNGIDVTYLVVYLKGGPAPFAGNCKK